MVTHEIRRALFEDNDKINSPKKRKFHEGEKQVTSSSSKEMQQNILELQEQKIQDQMKIDQLQNQKIRDQQRFDEIENKFNVLQKQFESLRRL